MLKNKDGSYNKISITILLSILVIGLGILISSLLSIGEDTILSIFILLSIISISGLLCYTFITKRKKNVIHHTVTVQPVVNHPSIKSFESQIKLIKKPSIDLITPLITLIIAAITFIVGFSIVNSMMSAIPTLPEGSEFNTQQAALNGTMASALNIFPIIIIIMATAPIIYFLFNLTRSNNDY
jgi:hypothetical protein